MNEWMDHPMLKNMDPVKLELIRSAASKTKGKSGKALAPVMMALITSANKKGIHILQHHIHTQRGKIRRRAGTD